MVPVTSASEKLPRADGYVDHQGHRQNKDCSRHVTQSLQSPAVISRSCAGAQTQVGHGDSFVKVARADKARADGVT